MFDFTNFLLALSGSAARRQIEEFEHRTIHADSSSVATLISNNETGARKLPDEKLKETHKEKTHSIPSNYWISESENVLKETMMWVTESLRSSRNVDCCIQYCTLIKSCADALVSLKRTRDFKFN